MGNDVNILIKGSKMTGKPQEKVLVCYKQTGKCTISIYKHSRNPPVYKLYLYLTIKKYFMKGRKFYSFTERRSSTISILKFNKAFQCVSREVRGNGL